MEEQGRLIKLPCKVGNTVWDNDFGRPESYTVTGFSFGDLSNDKEEIFEGISVYFSKWIGSGRISGKTAISQIGKSLFLTEEEAQQALKMMKER
jgi:hypothetical protein